MQLNQLPSIKIRSQKRLGRGYGSGKGGHTSSRGAKGQHARNKVHIWFEGGQLPLIRRMPFQRGKLKFKSLHPKPVIVNLKFLNVLPENSEVSLQTLIDRKIIKAIDAKNCGVKILGEGKLTRRLKVSLPTSKSAAAAIIKAGGSIISAKSTPTSSPVKTTKSVKPKSVPVPKKSESPKLKSRSHRSKTT